MRISIVRWTGVAVLAPSLWVGWGAEPPSQSPSTDRKIAPQDLLNIYIVGEKDIPFEFPVTSTGTIQFPFLEMVEVKDKTPAEVSAYLKEMLGKDYFVDPQVLVSVKQYRKQFVRVIGQVAKAGLVELPSEQRFDVIDVIAAAGGLNNLADKGKISVTRKGKTETFSLKKLKEIKDPAQKVWIEPDDTIEVGESFL